MWKGRGRSGWLGSMYGMILAMLVVVAPRHNALQSICADWVACRAGDLPH
jgi:hypothetical protein